MNGIEAIGAVSFDGDETLWDFQKVMRHALSVTLEELQRRVPGSRSADLSVERMIEIRDAVAREMKDEGVTHEEIRLRAFRRTAALVGCSDEGLIADLYAVYMRHRFEDIELYPDVAPTLDALPADITVGLLSNGNGYPERCGLRDRFDFVVFSQEVGFEKPDRRIFLEACDRASCAPQELMHVGDSLESDVGGANGVGAVSVWLNRNAGRNDSSIVPDYEIQSLADLGDILEVRPVVLGRTR